MVVDGFGCVYMAVDPWLSMCALLHFGAPCNRSYIVGYFRLMFLLGKTLQQLIARWLQVLLFIKGNTLWLILSEHGHA